MGVANAPFLYNIFSTEIFTIENKKLYQSRIIAQISDYQQVLKEGIRVIIDMTGMSDPIDDQIESILYWKIADGDAPDIKRLDAVAKYGVDCINAGLSVLTHCSEGVNRSGLVSARILMLLKGLTGQQAIDKVRAGRPGALQNQNFVKLLLSL